jgi:hypothetical protein
VEVTVVRLELEPGCLEYVIFNPSEEEIALDSLRTSCTYAYLTARGER